MRFIYLLLLLPFSLNAQYYIKKDHWVLGINSGVYLADKNTAHLYRGDATGYGVYSIFNNSINKPTFDDYFGCIDCWDIEELPQNMTYNPSMEIGLHLGKTKEKIKYYIDINFVNLKLQNYVIIAIDDPNNQSTEPTYTPIGIFGNEKRNLYNI